MAAAPGGVGPVGYRRWRVGPGQEGRWAGKGGCRWFACAGPRVSVLAGLVLVSWEKLGLAASSLGGTSPLGLGVGGNSCEGGCVVPDRKFSGSPHTHTLKREVTWEVLLLNIL